MVPIFIVAALVAGQGLDAPVTPKQPTVRSEIRRGMDAAWDCHEISALSQMERYEACISATESRNRQRMGTAFEAFDVGLYRMARDEMKNVVEALRDDPTPLFSIDLAKAGLDVEEAGYDQSKKALGLSEAQVESVVSIAKR